MTTHGRDQSYWGGGYSIPENFIIEFMKTSQATVVVAIDASRPLDLCAQCLTNGLQRHLT